MNQDNRISQSEFRSLYKWLLVHLRDACKTFIADYEAQVKAGTIDSFPSFINLESFTRE